MKVNDEMMNATVAEKSPHCQQKSRCKSICARLQFGFLSGGGITAAGINFGAAIPESALLLNRTRHLLQNITHTISLQRRVWNNERGAIKKKGSRLVSFSSHAKHIKELFAPAGILIAAHYQIAGDARACASLCSSPCVNGLLYASSPEHNAN